MKKYFPATELQRAREYGWNNQSGSQSTVPYQDDVIYAIFSNIHAGDTIIEVGCYYGGLSLQYAALAKWFSKKLIVVDFDAAMLDHAKKLVDELYPDLDVTYFKGTLADFIASGQFPDNVAALVLDADHSYENCRKDCLALKAVHDKCHMFIFHDFSMRRAGHPDQPDGVDRAIYEVFGKDVRLIPIGTKMTEPGKPNEDGVYIESSEGVILMTGWNTFA